MTEVKMTSRWKSVFERCVGKTALGNADDVYLLSEGCLRNETSQDGSQLPRCDDSAYFSSEDNSDGSFGQNINIVHVDSGLSNCHLNQACEEELIDSSHSRSRVPAVSRVDSIQARSLWITRRRHQKVALRRKMAVTTLPGDGSSGSEDETGSMTTPVHNQTPLSRASSVQIRYWEIRQKRKDLLHKRKSRGFESGCENVAMSP